MTKMDEKKTVGPSDGKKLNTGQFPDSKVAKPLQEPEGASATAAAKNEVRTNSPTTDMQNLVSDLNSFLSSTHKEIHTPKSTKKKYTNGSHDSNFKFGAKPLLTDSKAEKWSCQKCTLINSGHSRVCGVCGASRNFEKAEATIFDPPEVPHQDDQEEEQMPQKGNVLDRVVQFTAMQMIAREIPAAKPSLPIGMINSFLL